MNYVALLLTLLIGLFTAAPAFAQDVQHAQIAASLDRIERALSTRAAPVATSSALVQDMMSSAMQMQIAALQFQMVQDLAAKINPQGQRRSVFGLTNGGPQGAFTGLAVGGLLSHIGVLGASIPIGTALILGTIFGL